MDYERNRELEILCRKARENDHLLHTKITLGCTDLVLRIKRKGEKFYKTIAVDSFGPLPPLNFIRNHDMSPGSPKGRSPLEGEEEDTNLKRKRTNRDNSSSPGLQSKVRRPSVFDRSYDNPCTTVEQSADNFSITDDQHIS